MFLVFDTETNGLPVHYSASPKNVDNWPKIVQLSWGIYEMDGKEIALNDYIIKPDGFTITEESRKIHGITNEIANREGHPIKEALYRFREDWRKVKYICAHNFDFDIKVLGAECYRNNIKLGSKNIRKYICTMKNTTEFCQIPHTSFDGLKWPKLQELYYKLFQTNFDNAHNSLYDVKACARCLFCCLERKIITL